MLVGDTGIEPVTSSVSRKRSPTELIARGGGGNRTRVQGFAGPCLNHSATPPCPQVAVDPTQRSRGTARMLRGRSRADDGIRTRDPHLGKVMRYQLRYVRTSQSNGRRMRTLAEHAHERQPGVGARASPDRGPPALIDPCKGSVVAPRGHDLGVVDHRPVGLRHRHTSAAVALISLSASCLHSSSHP